MNLVLKEKWMNVIFTLINGEKHCSKLKKYFYLI